MSASLRASGVAALALLLAGCGPSLGKPQTVVETVVQDCPVQMVEPDCPDFPATKGVPREVALKERDVIYARCRGWARVVWAGRQDCESRDDR